MRMLVCWFALGLGAQVTFCLLSLADVSLWRVWPLLGVVAISIWKLSRAAGPQEPGK